MADLTDLQLRVNLFKYTQYTDAPEESITLGDIRLERQSSMLVASLNYSRLFGQGRCDSKEECFIKIELLNSGERVQGRVFYPTSLKESDLRSGLREKVQSHLQLELGSTSSTEDGETGYTRHLKLKVVNQGSSEKESVAAHYVTLESLAMVGHFSENSFLLLPLESKEVTFYPKISSSSSQWEPKREEFRVRSYNEMLLHVN
mmetsp:Transcript_16175/g.27371  ORF Transcript_16175/g.27371 Transcript_16175/m.27371 type:complete len:203 (-) Transcript_16175:24-632(-)